MPDHDKVLNKYWLTDFTSSSSDSSSSGSSSTDTEDQIVKIATIFITLIMQLTLGYTMRLYDKIPYHTSALTGEMWVL